MRETVRSGRREGFYTTDNGFIDYYARELRPVDIAVYHALERYMNCHTRSTWVGTARIAEVLNVSQRTVQRSLKALDDRKLIKIVQTATVKIFYVVPLPSRPKKAPTPLFDALGEEEFSFSDTSVAVAPPESPWPTRPSRGSSTQSREATVPSGMGVRDDGPYKEEQDLPNKTTEQDFSDNQEHLETRELARRILNILKLPESFLSRAVAAVENRRKWTKLSPEGMVSEIVTDANKEARRGISGKDFLENFLAKKLASEVLRDLSLPDTTNLVSTVTASIRAEGAYTGSALEEVARFITNAALKARSSGMTVDRFFFENVKWRSHGPTGKGQQQFERIKRARDEAHAIIDAQMDH